MVKLRLTEMSSYSPTALHASINCELHNGVIKYFRCCQIFSPSMPLSARLRRHYCLSASLNGSFLMKLALSRVLAYSFHASLHTHFNAARDHGHDAPMSALHRQAIRQSYYDTMSAHGLRWNRHAADYAMRQCFVLDEISVRKQRAPKGRRDVTFGRRLRRRKSAVSVMPRVIAATRSWCRRRQWWKCLHAFLPALMRCISSACVARVWRDEADRDVIFYFWRYDAAATFRGIATRGVRKMWIGRS